jgi:hypothetical protein
VPLRTPVTQANNTVSGAESILMGVTTVLQNIAGRQDRALLEATKKSEESKPYDECDIAALMGYCGVRSPDEVPALWPQLKQTKKPVDQRALILNAMEQWAFDERKEIDTTFFLSKEVLEDIMKIQPNDTNTVGMNSTTARGVSNLVVLPRRMAEIETMMKLEEAADKTEYSRTLKEAERLAKAETRAPPRTYYTLKLNVATYATLVFVLYGRHCDLYRKLIAIYNILSTKEVVTCRDAFTPMICKQITWAIYDDSRSFFAKRLLPSQFQHRDVPFPVSLLDEIYNSVRFINEIRRPTFPPSWVEQPKQEKDEYESQGNGPMAFLSPYGNEGAEGTMAMAVIGCTILTQTVKAPIRFTARQHTVTSTHFLPRSSQHSKNSTKNSKARRPSSGLCKQVVSGGHKCQNGRNTTTNKQTKMNYVGTK